MSYQKRFQKAVKNNNLILVKRYLLLRKLNPSTYYFCAFLYASQKKYNDILKLLIEDNRINHCCSE
jgi:hypothetical protein